MPKQGLFNPLRKDLPDGQAGNHLLLRCFPSSTRRLHHSQLGETASGIRRNSNRSLQFPGASTSVTSKPIDRRNGTFESKRGIKATVLFSVREVTWGSQRYADHWLKELRTFTLFRKNKFANESKNVAVLPKLPILREIRGNLNAKPNTADRQGYPNYPRLQPPSREQIKRSHPNAWREAN